VACGERSWAQPTWNALHPIKSIHDCCLGVALQVESIARVQVAAATRDIRRPATATGQLAVVRLDAPYHG
jgi:hypothetical protein